MSVLNTGYQAQDGQEVHPMVGNTAKDGTGTWYVPLLDSSGQLVIGSISAVSLSAGSNIIGKVGHDKTTIKHGVKTVTAVGTDEPLVGTPTPAKTVIVQAQTDNTGAIAVGGQGVDATVTTGSGVLLYAGESITLEVDDLADVYIDATVAGEGVRYTYEA